MLHVNVVKLCCGCSLELSFVDSTRSKANSSRSRPGVTGQLPGDDCTRCMQYADTYTNQHHRHRAWWFLDGKHIYVLFLGGPFEWCWYCLFDVAFCFSN